MGIHNLDFYDATFTDYNLSNCINYEMDTMQLHKIEIIHLDTINKILSGKFNLSVFNADCQDSLHITDGRFDVIY